MAYLLRRNPTTTPGLPFHQVPIYASLVVRGRWPSARPYPLFPPTAYRNGSVKIILRWPQVQKIPLHHEETGVGEWH